MSRGPGLLLLAAVLPLAAVGCGGDDDGGATTAPSMASSTQLESPAPTTAPEEPEPAQPEEPRAERTPASLAQCIRGEPGVGDVLVKAADSEDASFFGDLVGGRVDVLGVTLDGEPAEITVALFASAADATKAAPDAGGGGGLHARAQGSAVIVAPAGADTTAIGSCLRATRYAGG